MPDSVSISIKGLPGRSFLSGSKAALLLSLMMLNIECCCLICMTSYHRQPGEGGKTWVHWVLREYLPLIGLFSFHSL